MSPRIALVAAEPSGDQLGAALISALKQTYPDVDLIGIGGPEMVAAGLVSRYPMEKLSIMGLVEVLPHLAELLKMRQELGQWLLSQQPDIFIGIDAPDFNLGLALRLKENGVKTLQYVSPTVWAWKQGRVKKIRQAVDKVLCLFPFEQQFLEKHRITATYVGHPLADQLQMEPDRSAAREKLGLDNDARVLALLPGSRLSEVRRLTTPFLETAKRVESALGELTIVVPLINETTRQLFVAQAGRALQSLDIRVVERSAITAMTAADVVLLASGTATLQGLLCKRPMVVGYRLNPLTYQITSLLKLIKIRYVAMANLLCDEMLAPEFIQNDCRAELMAPAVLTMFQDQEKVSAIQQRYCKIHQLLRCDAAHSAAEAVLSMIEEESA